MRKLLLAGVLAARAGDPPRRGEGLARPPAAVRGRRGGGGCPSLGCGDGRPAAVHWRVRRRSGRAGQHGKIAGATIAAGKRSCLSGVCLAGWRLN